MSAARKAPPTHARLLVRVGDYNGHKDVLFMMKQDDWRLTDERFAPNHTVVANGTYTHRHPEPGVIGTLVADGVAYGVFSDWSVREEAAS